MTLIKLELSLGFTNLDNLFGISQRLLVHCLHDKLVCCGIPHFMPLLIQDIMGINKNSLKSVNLCIIEYYYVHVLYLTICHIDY